MSLPAILFAGDLAPLLGWTRQRVAVFLRTNGLAEQTVGGRHRVFTTPQRIAAFSPTVLAALEVKWEESRGGEPLRLDDFGDLDDVG